MPRPWKNPQFRLTFSHRIRPQLGNDDWDQWSRPRPSSGRSTAPSITELRHPGDSMRSIDWIRRLPSENLHHPVIYFLGKSKVKVKGSYLYPKTWRIHSYSTTHLCNPRHIIISPKKWSSEQSIFIIKVSLRKSDIDNGKLQMSSFPSQRLRNLHIESTPDDVITNGCTRGIGWNVRIRIFVGHFQHSRRTDNFVSHFFDGQICDVGNDESAESIDSRWSVNTESVSQTIC